MHKIDRLPTDRRVTFTVYISECLLVDDHCEHAGWCLKPEIQQASKVKSRTFTMLKQVNGWQWIHACLDANWTPKNPALRPDAKFYATKYRTSNWATHAPSLLDRQYSHGSNVIHIGSEPSTPWGEVRCPGRLPAEDSCPRGCWKWGTPSVSSILSQFKLREEKIMIW